MKKNRLFAVLHPKKVEDPCPKHCPFSVRIKPLPSINIWDTLDSDQISQITHLLSDTPDALYDTIKTQIQQHDQPYLHKQNIKTEPDMGGISKRLKNIKSSNRKLIKQLETYRPKPMMQSLYPFGYTVKEAEKQLPLKKYRVVKQKSINKSELPTLQRQQSEGGRGLFT